MEARAAGVPFDDAWESAVGRVVRKDDGSKDLVGGSIRWPHDTAHRREWKAILSTKKQRNVWRSAYVGAAPTRHDTSLTALIAA